MAKQVLEIVGGPNGSGKTTFAETALSRRFSRTFENFRNLYAPLSDEWHIIDNTASPVEIAMKKHNRIQVFEREKYNQYFL